MDCIRILMVDDDKEDYLITEELLSDLKHQTNYVLEWMPEYDKALQTILKKEHDVYLIDFMIGIYNGLDLIKEVRDKGCDAPLILLTGQSNPEIDQQAMLVGASDFLIKGKNNAAELLDRAIRYEIRHAENMRKIQNLNLELEKRVRERTLKLTETVLTLASANKTLTQTLEEKQQIELALEESQKLYSAMAKNFPSGLIGILNKDFKFIFIEGSELKRNHNLDQNLIGTSLLELIPSGSKEAVVKLIDQSAAGLSVEFDVENDKKTYAINLEPLSDENGDIKQFLIVMRNITEQKQAEEKIRKALKKEIELNELKSRFVTMASHEFRTPLGAVTTSLSLLEQYIQPEPDSKPAKHIKRIKLSVKQLIEILNDFLSLDKLEQGKTEKTCIDFNLKEFGTDVVDGLQGILKEGQVINYNFSGKERIYEDKKILQNVLLNLLSNASKYSPENSAIDLTINTSDEAIDISVRDRGIGIPEEDQAMMFSRFFRAQNAVNIQGTGLGLNIVKRYVQLLNGTISFQSRLNEGSVFTIQLKNTELRTC